MNHYINVLIQVFDYIVKAIWMYKDTEQGAKEWQDIYDAWESVEDDRNNPNAFSVPSGTSAEAVVDKATRKAERIFK